MVYFYSERPLLSKIFYSMCGLFLYRKTAALQRSVARGFGGVSQIMLLFFFFFYKTLESNIMVYHKEVSDYTTFTLMIT